MDAKRLAFKTSFAKKIAILHNGQSFHILLFWKTGAGEGIRTLDPDLGKIRLAVSRDSSTCTEFH